MPDPFTVKGDVFINEMNRFQKAVMNCTSSISIYAADRYADAAYWVQSEPSVAEQKLKATGLPSTPRPG